MALSRHFGALTSVWVVPLLDQEFTPWPRLPPSSVREDSEFDWVAEGIAPLTTQSVTLPLTVPLGRLDCGLFRREPAITGHDWLITPRPGSWERISPQHPFGPPRLLRGASPYPGLDRPVSGLAAVTPRPLDGAPRCLRASRFRYGCGLSALTLATAANSPAHYSKRTLRP